MVLVAGVCVTAAPVAGGPNAVLAVSAADGSYQATGLLPGQYTVEFQSGCGASGYQVQWWDDAATAAAATKVTVTAGTTTAGVSAAMQP